MHEDAVIDRTIALILAGSGLPLERRAEVADELRSHVEQLIAAKRDAGLTDERAVEAALTCFGSPDVIRTQLKRQQQRLDRRRAFFEYRRCIWWLVPGCGLFAAACAMLAPGSAAVWPRLLVGACLFVGMLLMTSVPMYFGELLRLHVKRLRPIAEYSLFKSFGRNAVFVFVGLMYTLVIDPFLIGILVYAGRGSLFQSIVQTTPEAVERWPWLFWRNFGIAACESPIFSFVVPTVAVIVSGLAIALYERSRCVDVATFPLPE